MAAAFISKAAQAVDPESEVRLYGGHVRGFRAQCELVLGLLALRGTAHGRTLDAGSPRMVRLAKLVRRADCLLTRSGKRVRSSLRLNVSKPKELSRVSDLAFALNSFLIGSEEMNLIRIESVVEED